MDFSRLSQEVCALLDYDRAHIWHPYTSISDPQQALLVKKAEGCCVTVESDDPEGYTIIEAMSSWWCMIHGYNNAELNEAASKQLSSFSHIMFGGFTHRPAIELTKRLLQMADSPNLEFCFFADSGSVAIEAALKMAIQSQAASKKTKFLTISNGYHGDTLGAASVCDPLNSKHCLYPGFIPENIFAKAPGVIDYLPSKTRNVRWDAHEIDDFRDKIGSNRKALAAVILEPLLQGAGGLRLYHPQFLIEVRKLCSEYDIPLIMDEIATGFGRTGEMFAFHHCKKYQDLCGVPPERQVNVFPDILCIGKGLTGGYMTLSAVLTSQRISGGISGPKNITGGCFMQGPTFMANPLACSVANKSMEILQRGDWKVQVDRIENQLFAELYAPIRCDEQLMKFVVRGVRIAGAVGVVELREMVDKKWFQEQFLRRGVHVRPFNRLCYIMPPYIITREELKRVTGAIIATLKLWFKVKHGCARMSDEVSDGG
ncbi:LAMI_0F16622g1_1 [Lachancea mirantina]|uniref:LAMI_0F16622g1_1 n=1 Tax=Lachancea mirantina TaxID=1230905 RepID=A0A1G4K567_9SACH|nr:LAMI_0F16622g1_1 [Lachancea mirantina]